MIHAYTAAQVREAEQPLLEAGVPLMEQAAAALAEHVAQVAARTAGACPGARILLLVGTGSNGGDTLIAGARLAEEGAHVVAVPVAERLHEDGAAALREAGGRIEQPWTSTGPGPQRRLPDADVVVDGILGTGARAGLTPEIAALLRAAAALDAAVVAVDVPTGVDATTGAVDDAALTADLTVTFGAAKTGLLLPPGRFRAGQVRTAPIGIEDHLPATPALRSPSGRDLRPLFPVPGSDAHKYSRGVVSMFTGSPTFPGAAILGSLGAAAAGAGMIRYLGDRAVLEKILDRRPEVVGAPGRAQAAVIGSGTDPDAPVLAAAADALAEGLPAVLDAGGLDLIDPGQDLRRDRVLTPHQGEAERLRDRLDVTVDDHTPLTLARTLAAATGATVLLKGGATLVVDPEAPDLPWVVASGTPYLATAGTGDVLAGIIGTLLAAGLSGPDAAVLGAHLHGRAGWHASGGSTHPLAAADLAAHLPTAIGEL